MLGHQTGDEVAGAARRIAEDDPQVAVRQGRCLGLGAPRDISQGCERQGPGDQVATFHELFLPFQVSERRTMVVSAVRAAARSMALGSISHWVIRPRTAPRITIA